MSLPFSLLIIIAMKAKNSNSLELSYNEYDKGFYLRISRQGYEMNLFLSETELVLIPQVKTALWSEHSSIKIGNCAGISAFWSCEEGELSILVGQDDECWQFGTILPESVLDEIIDKIRNETDLL